MVMRKDPGKDNTFHIPDIAGMGEHEEGYKNAYPGEMLEEFDYSKEFDADMKDHLEAICQWCAKKHVPMLFSMCIERSKEHTGCVTTGHIPGSPYVPHQFEMAHMCLQNYDAFIDAVKTAAMITFKQEKDNK